MDDKIRKLGQSAKSWMDENGICEQSYYHWQRRLRKQAYEEMKGNASVPAVAEKTELTFVEIPCRTSEEPNTYMVSDKGFDLYKPSLVPPIFSNS